MTKRTIRHWRTKFKAAPIALAVLALALLVGTLFRGSWRWGIVQGNTVGGIVTFYAAVAFLVLVLLVIRAAGRSWLHWRQEQEAEDAERCVLPECDAVLKPPYAYEPGLGKLCLPCVKRIAAAINDDDLPGLARRAGA